MIASIKINDQVVTKSRAKESISNLLAQIYNDYSSPEAQYENLLKSLELAQEIAWEFEMVNMKTRLGKAILRLKKGLIAVEKIPEFTFNLCMSLEGMGNYKDKGKFVKGNYKFDAPGRDCMRKEM
jgi:hypothetical protein